MPLLSRAGRRFLRWTLRSPTRRRSERREGRLGRIREVLPVANNQDASRPRRLPDPCMTSQVLLPDRVRRHAHSTGTSRAASAAGYRPPRASGVSRSSEREATRDRASGCPPPTGEGIATEPGGVNVCVANRTRWSVPTSHFWIRRPRPFADCRRCDGAGHPDPMDHHRATELRLSLDRLTCGTRPVSAASPALAYWPPATRAGALVIAPASGHQGRQGMVTRPAVLRPS
jgi:hypothetical protein